MELQLESIGGEDSRGDGSEDSRGGGSRKQRSFRSKETPTELLERQKEILAAAAKEAERKIDFAKAHNEDILLAIDIVEKFLRKKHRICYGGQAMNMHLPKAHKFYDPETSLPDYDFLTPDGKGDITLLLRMLHAEGFTEVSDRQGMHEGTTKIYVNFIAVADVTEINPVFYNIISKRSVDSDGITYMDADTLRMMMYLELSRPMGEVSRWEKVFERLLLLNAYAKPRLCRRTRQKTLSYTNYKGVPAKLRQKILNFAIEELRVLAGADVLDFYKYRLRHPIHITWLFKARGPVILYSRDPEEDIKKLHSRTTGALTFKKYTAEAEFFPLVYIGYTGSAPAIAIIQETACHAYNTISLKDGRNIRIASLDTLITLYLSFLFRSSLQDLFLKPIGCMVEQMIQLQNLYRTRSDSPFPFISIECSGHQKTFASLLREKIARIKTLKARKANQAQSQHRQTAKRSTPRRSTPKRRAIKGVEKSPSASTPAVEKQS